MVHHTLYADYFDEIIEENHDTIIDCLAEQKIISIQKTKKGYRFVELCDEYYGGSLNQEQFERLIAELQKLARSQVSE